MSVAGGQSDPPDDDICRECGEQTDDGPEFNGRCRGCRDRFEYPQHTYPDVDDSDLPCLTGSPLDGQIPAEFIYDEMPELGTVVTSRCPDGYERGCQGTQRVVSTCELAGRGCPADCWVLECLDCTYREVQHD